MIITNNLYGVDIEEGAGEIGKLRLWLSMIADVPKDISLVEPLPNIEYNIRCGNSLIGFTTAAQIVDDKDLSKKSKKKIVWNTLSGSQISLDTYQPDSIFHLYFDRNQLIHQYKEADDSKNSADLKDAIDQKTYEYNQVLNKKLYDEIVFEKGIEISEEAFANLKPFHWIMEFSDIFERGGFDVVVGNPPYIRLQTMKKNSQEQVEYYKDQYQVAKKGNYDIYVVFVEKSLALLNKTGIMGYILPHKFFNNKYGQALRKFIADGRHLKSIIHFGHQQIFIGATTYTCLLFLGKSGYNTFEFTKVDDLNVWVSTPEANVESLFASTVTDKEWNFVVGKNSKLFDKLNNFIPKLGNIAQLFVGLQTDADDVFILEQKEKKGDKILCHSNETGQDHWFEDSHLKPFLKGSLNIRRYYLDNINKRLIFPYELVNGKSVLISSEDYKLKYPLTWDYLEKTCKRLSERNKGQMGKLWYGYVYKKNHTKFGYKKIVAPSLANSACFMTDLEGKYFFVGSGGGGGGGYGITLNPKEKISYYYLLGLLNSSLSTFYLKKISSTFRGGYFALNRQYIEQIPIRMISFSNSTEVDRHNRMITLVKQMLDLNKTNQDNLGANERTLLAQQIKMIDTAIDNLVYDLYGLTQEEIEIIESNLKIN
jgi:hypothetical protein